MIPPNAFDTVWPSAKNLVPPGHGSLKKQGRECVQLSLVRSNLPGSGAIQTPPTKGISLVATPIDVRSGSFGARLGAGLWLKGLRTGPNRPTGPPTTSNCSRMSCSHHHHAEVLAQGLASTLHSPRFPEANEEKSLPQRVAPSVPTETSGRTEESGGGRWRRRQQRALLWRPRSSLPQILEAGLELLLRREAPCSARGSRGFAFFLARLYLFGARCCLGDG